MSAISPYRHLIFIPIEAAEVSPETRFRALKTALIDNDFETFLSLYDLESVSVEMSRSLLCQALILNRTSIIAYLIEPLEMYLSYLAEKTIPPLILAFYLNDMVLATQLLENGVPIDSEDEEGAILIQHAIRQKKTDWAEWFFRHGGNIDASGKDRRTPLMMAIEEGLFIFVDFLIMKGAGLAKQSIYGETPLLIALKHSFFFLIPKLAPTPEIVNIQKNDGTSALMIACTYREIEAVSALIMLGAHVNLIDLEGESALYKSIRIIDDILVATLLKAHANPNISVRHFRKTPLILAIELNNLNIVLQLLRAGADPKASDQFGFTPLHFAAKMGHDALIPILLKCNPDIDALSIKGYTPLAIAAHFNDAKIIHLLLTAGAKPSIEGVPLSNAWEIAFQRGFKETGTRLFLADPSVSKTS